MGRADDILREIAIATGQAPGGVGGLPPNLAGQQATRPAGGGAPATGPAARRIVIVCCMDPRLRPEMALGIPPGGATVIRNTGGTVTDETLYALKAAYDVFGAREFVLMGHADCAFAYDAAGQWDTGGAKAALAQAERVRAWPDLPHDVVVRAVVVPNLAMNRTVPAEVALTAPVPSAPPPVAAPPNPATVPPPRATQRRDGRLERENLVRVPPALPAMPPTLTWEQKNPSSADFQRKVAEMTSSEAEPLHALPDISTLDVREPEETKREGRLSRPKPGGLIGELDAGALVRAIALGDVLEQPKGRRALRVRPK